MGVKCWYVVMDENALLDHKLVFCLSCGEGCEMVWVESMISLVKRNRMTCI